MTLFINLDRTQILASTLDVDFMAVRIHHANCFNLFFSYSELWIIYFI